MIKSKTDDDFLNEAKRIEKLLVSVDELATMLNVSTRTIWRRLSAGEIPSPVRIGGSVRWRVNDVTDWIACGCPVKN